VYIVLQLNYVVSILVLVRWLFSSSLTKLCTSARLLCRHSKFHINKATSAKLS